jgi:hypothetical protein
MVSGGCKIRRGRLPVLLGSGALLRGNGGEGRPALFYLVTTAVRAGGLSRVMLCHGQSLREWFLAGVAQELIVGHTDLPRSWIDYSWILDPRLEQLQYGSDSTRRSRYLLFRPELRRRRILLELRAVSVLSQGFSAISSHLPVPGFPSNPDAKKLIRVAMAGNRVKVAVRACFTAKSTRGTDLVVPCGTDSAM